MERVSGPIVDRIDLHVEVASVPFDRLAGAPCGDSSEAMRAKVIAARSRQRARQGAALNAHLRGAALDAAASLGTESRSLLADAMGRLGLSARAYDKIRRIARTVADLEGADGVSAVHVAEAIQYRVLDRYA